MEWLASIVCDPARPMAAPFDSTCIAHKLVGIDQADDETKISLVKEGIQKDRGSPGGISQELQIGLFGIVNNDRIFS